LSRFRSKNRMTHSETKRMSDPLSGLTPEERSIVNILSYGSPAARQEIIIKLIYLGKIEALQKVYDSMNDAVYAKCVPLA